MTPQPIFHKKKIKRKRVKIVKSQPMISTKMKKFNEVCCFSKVDFRRKEFKKRFRNFSTYNKGRKKKTNKSYRNENFTKIKVIGSTDFK
jgi:hypothetical protein